MLRYDVGKHVGLSVRQKRPCNLIVLIESTLTNFANENADVENERWLAQPAPVASLETTSIQINHDDGPCYFVLAGDERMFH